MVCYFFAAYFGARMTKNLEEKTLEYMAAVYFLVISVFFFWNAYTGTFGEHSKKKKDK
jgi:putative Ca2+/H+ antiporter (TMEM165/GDT1 family)